MKDFLLSLFEQYPALAVFISLGISVLVAVAGVLPSIFITAANILFFGFWPGMLISFLGESLGAALSFLLYRKGFQKQSQKGLDRFPSIRKLVNAEGRDAVTLVFALRLLPLVPSGFITLGAAIGKIRFIPFLLASSLGKLPALLIEAYSVKQVTMFGWQGKLILGLLSIYMIYLIVKRLRRK
ncbi:MAG TPA: VTT domain-containing protein [Chitinophagaceae bacterium]|nr:VTT domain-containing protein [Chitinophagaceae bacterium]